MIGVAVIIALINKYINKYRRLFKFGIVGVLNTLVDFVSFTILNTIGINYILCQVVGYSIGTLNSYVFNKNWTFKRVESNKKIHEEVIQFIIVNIFSLVITELGLILLVNNFKFNIYIAKACVIILAQIVNYFSYKLLVFKN